MRKKKYCTFAAVSCFGVSWLVAGPCLLQMHSLVYLLFTRWVYLCLCDVCYVFVFIYWSQIIAVAHNVTRKAWKDAREEKKKQRQQQMNERTKFIFIFQCHDNFNSFENCMLLFILICRRDLFLHTHYYNSNVFFLSSLLFGTCVRAGMCVCVYLLSLI